MTTRPPAEIGMSLAEIDTPALLIDLDAYERNLKRLAAKAAAAGMRLRPHAKTHKSAVIALQQVALGAVGVCCQKTSEAEALVHGGVRDVLVSNEVVGRPKLRRLAALAKLARIGVCVDDAGQVGALGAAAVEAGATLDVYVEINLGADRCGVEPGEPALRLAREIAKTPGLSFAGLQAYHGSAQHLRTHEERKRAIAGAASKAKMTRDLLEGAGLRCGAVTGAGTGTFEHEAASGVWTELQCGSYIFMDADYGRNLDAAGQPVSDFEQSLFVWATVMSRSTEERAVLDAGLKALSVDSGFPLLRDHPDVEYVRAADEHGKLKIARPTNALRVGDKVRLVPGHCDPTVNLYDWYVGVRGDRVEAIWPIVGRGALT